ncbi:hypothetical protein FQA39_LY16250 [Lamprigera yunnana]|nr:hypothetical protein FQA39_LY16250 [Lamprigera yunnana]
MGRDNSEHSTCASSSDKDENLIQMVIEKEHSTRASSSDKDENLIQIVIEKVLSNNKFIDNLLSAMINKYEREECVGTSGRRSVCNNCTLQAFILKKLLSDYNGMSFRYVIDEELQDKVLIHALCEILQHCSRGSYYIVYLKETHSDANSTCSSLVNGGETFGLGTAGDWNARIFHNNLGIHQLPLLDDVVKYYKENIQALKAQYGVLLFLYSVIATKDLEYVRLESDTTDPLIDETYGYGSQKSHKFNDYRYYLLNEFMDEFFPKEESSTPDMFQLIHYNGLARSNVKKQVQYHFGSAILLESDLKSINDSDPMLTCLQTKWPNIEILLTSGGTTLQIKKYIFNQGYNPTTLKNNIALIQTFDRILNTWGTAVVPINLASVLLGQVGYISGWGQVNLSSSVYSTKLKYIRATVIAINYCKQLLPQYIIDDTMLCTLDIGQGNCHGDNGNPLVSNNVLIGLVSWGIPCAVGKPDVLTNIVSFSSWIILNSQN